VYAYMGIHGNDTHMSSSPLQLINPPPPLSFAAVLHRRHPSLPPPLSSCRCQSPCCCPLSKKGEFYSQRGDRCGSDIFPKMSWVDLDACCCHRQRRREAAPAACKLALPWSPSHGQCECNFCQLRYFVLLYSLAVWRIVPNFVGPLATRRECHTSLKRRV
jgi:hypothetical protein